jgi:hypothetical protein
MSKIEVISCKDITIDRWNELMRGAVPMDYNTLKNIIWKKHPKLYNKLCLDAYNPYWQDAKQTSTHYILVHSMTEYFIRK